jgi:MarR-like DNA-binding transcriptional regulator SgrR of sgrS sRNA
MLTDSVDQDTENPIGKLPDGYRIGIFSLRESSAQRVKQLLEARNSSLNVRICTEKDLNEQAKAIAQNADLVVVVWTCLSHALSYGIEPYLQEKPVFPQSSGSTSIMRAIEERVRQTNRI